ncbi:hypothetical protein C5167_016757 [Papaver somniferum]|nr:hypothetical protein C5167_016755 [Papaver somniferum]RZC94062.1 hypothetical protein C5167_016757 [Papaver somniferum]
MRIKCARSSDLELRMLKERMFLPISGIFTKQSDKQVKRICYAQSSQIREVKLGLSNSTFSYHFM